MWDEEDTSGRVVHLLCGLILLPIAFCCGYFAVAGWDDSTYSSSGYRSGGAATLCLGALYLSIRCLWYAITGKDNINRDDF